MCFSYNKKKNLPALIDILFVQIQIRKPPWRCLNTRTIVYICIKKRKRTIVYGTLWSKFQPIDCLSLSSIDQVCPLFYAILTSWNHFCQLKK